MLKTIALSGIFLALSWGSVSAKAVPVLRAASTGDRTAIETDNWFMQATRNFVAGRVAPSRGRHIARAADDNKARR